MEQKIPRAGEVREGAEIMAVHMHEGHPGEQPTGVVLAWREHRREYAVWTVGPEGEFSNGWYRGHGADALRVYSERVMSRLFSHHNLAAPTYTYERENRQ